MMACFETSDTVEYTSSKVVVKVETVLWNKNVILLGLYFSVASKFCRP